MVVDGLAHPGVFIMRAGEQLDGEDVGVAVHHAAGEVGAHLRHPAGAFAQAGDDEAQHDGVTGEPAEDGWGQTPVDGEQQQQGAAAIDHDVPAGIEGHHQAFAHRRPGLHDPVGDAAGEVVLEEGPALADHVPVVLPADHVGQAGIDDLVEQHRVAEEHTGSDQQ